MTNPAPPRPTVDDYLGDGDKRFFSAGYRRVGYHFGPVTTEVATARDAAVRTTVGLTYPTDWSKKSAGVDLRPHLSTIDAILFGVGLAELCVVSAFGADDEARRAMWVRRVRIRAGQSPEEDLRQLPLSARLTETAAEPGGLSTVSTVDCQVGSMRVRCELVHAGGAVRPGKDQYDGPDALLGPAADRYYGTGFARVRHSLEDLSLDVPNTAAEATVRWEPSDATAGVEGAYQPAPTMVEAFATGLQLAQVLLYEMDGMRRSGSNTLWMRSTTLTATRPAGGTGPLALRTTLANTGLIEMNGGVWRTADIHTDLAGIRFTCAVAHALPRGI
ncbi:AvrD family protein [Actinokineospora cianjurensis]|uniref:Avirulence D protein (AvrD) n=1 Tax=Actinokineospora cianjurensis TaxID=585224 RepID=A0A421AZ37_9PSEU|nr:AvrD family protein [Actinokineospora cianjurensis]RLK55086.1 avirulence D protein (AvrD) [Actinokineospora cianjurensis]